MSTYQLLWSVYWCFHLYPYPASLRVVQMVEPPKSSHLDHPDDVILEDYFNNNWHFFNTYALLWRKLFISILVTTYALLWRKLFISILVTTYALLWRNLFISILVTTVLSCHVLSCFIVSSSIVSCPVQSYPILSFSVVPYRTIFCPVL